MLAKSLFSPYFAENLVLQHLTALALLGLVVATGCGRRDAPSVIRGDASETVAVTRQRLQSEASIEATDAVLVAVGNRTLDERFGPLKGLGSLEAADQKALAAILEARTEPAARKLESSVAAHEKFLANEFEPGWKKLAETWLATSLDRDRFERNERKAQQTALALGTEHRWFWLSSLIAVASLLALFAADRRHEIRRFFNGGRAKELFLGWVLVVAFGLLCILTTALFVASDGILVDLLDRSSGGEATASVRREAEADAVRLAELKTRQSSQRNEVELLREKLEAEFAQQLPAATAGALFDSWWSYWKAATSRQAQIKALEGGEARFDEALAAVRDNATKIATARESTEQWRTRAARLTGFIGLGVLSLVTAGVVMFVRGLRARTRKLADTCPMCLAQGKLQESDGKSDASGSGNGIPAGMVRCANVISESPFEECDFDFPSMFRGVQKLCFPTLGLRNSGKTTWLAMVYRELNRGNFPDEIEFAKIRSSGSEEFDRIVDDIIVAKQGPRATQTNAIPKPVVFNFIDRDKLGRSNILVNIFDFSGEVYQKNTNQNQRDRALAAEGYFLFLDPLESSDLQLQHLVNFRQDVRVAKGLKAGQQIHCPVALCVPKIDLLPNEDYARGGNVIERFYEELGAVGWDMDTASIRKRSELMRGLRETVWPGWEIERTIDDLFGGRYMFFPLTPYGLNEPGVDALSQRNISPLGILQPLMWLLHMNGYPILNSGNVSKIG